MADGYSTSAVRRYSQRFSASVTVPSVTTSSRRPGSSSRNSASAASELPSGGVGPASTSRPSQPRWRRSAHTSRAKRRFLCRYEAPMQSRNPSSSGDRPAGRSSLPPTSTGSTPHDTTAVAAPPSTSPSARAASRLRSLMNATPWASPSVRRVTSRYSCQSPAVSK